MTRAIDDAGERIEGARKDWKARPLASGELASMTDEEIVAAARKDNVWPKPDWEAAVAAGMEPMAAALVKIARDRMAQEPKDRRGVDGAWLRKAFVRMTEAVRDELTACRDVDGVRKAARHVLERYGGSPKGDAALEYLSVYKGRSCPFSFGHADLRKAEGMVRDGFPAQVPAWKARAEARAGADGAFFLVRGDRILQDGFASEAEAWAWLEAQSRGGAKRRRKEWSRPRLDRLERSGMPFALDGDVSPEAFIETFGFRGVQFGNWLPDGERQQVLNMGFEAMMDLAWAMGWEPSQMSLGGTLAVAFGARGQGGRHSAHYEPGQRVINMTRMSGAGALAHEFGHALDHWSGTGTQAPVPGGVPSGSGWRTAGRGRRAVLAHRGEEAVDAWEAVMHAIYREGVTKPERVAMLEARLGKLRADAEDARRHILKAEEKPGYAAAAWLAKARERMEDNARHDSLAVQALAAVKALPDDTIFGEGPSGFVRESARMGGGYWVRPNELFARAFEAWAFDRVAEAGGRSEYLVHSAGEPESEPEEGEPRPFPEGQQRKRIGAAMERLCGAMQPFAPVAEDAPSPRM